MAAGLSGPGVQDDGRARLLAEVEVGPQVTQDGDVLPHVRTRIAPAIGRRIDARTTQEVVLDELQVGIEAERLVVDVALPR